jgi:hypothetical protein
MADVVEINAQTQEVIERVFNERELAQRERDAARVEADAAAAQAEVDAEKAAKQAKKALRQSARAKLIALGLSEDEAQEIAGI